LRTFGPKTEEVAEGWRRIHNEELQNFYASPDIIRAIKSSRVSWVRYVVRMGGRRNAYKILIGKPEGKRPLGSPRHRRKDIRMALREIGRESVNWIHVNQIRELWRAFLNTVMNLRLPQMGMNFLTS
jgi:hypothetical protein